MRTDLHQELRFAKPQGSFPVSGDPTRLEQIFVNLLTNAAKFTPIHGHVWVKVARDESTPGEPRVEVRIRDDGEGISPSSLPHIFDLFVQGSRSLGTIQAGVGIGLTLAQRLAQMHGGSIEATSAGLALGSEFIVRLPLVPVTEELAAGDGKSKDTEETPTRRILIVDDNVDAAETQGMLLRATGHEVRVAHEGTTALQLARTFLPEVVLLDIGMPGEDGYSVARKMRAEPGLSEALIVAVTGFGRDTDVKKSRDAGFDAHLTKPVEQHRIQSLLAGSKR
jgi:two-component system CheB/CheR fusion protein